MDRRLREREDDQQTTELVPVQSGRLAPSHQGFEPHPLHQLIKLIQRSVVEDDAVVAVVPAQDLAQPGVLAYYREFVQLNRPHAFRRSSDTSELPLGDSAGWDAPF